MPEAIEFHLEGMTRNGERYRNLILILGTWKCLPGLTDRSRNTGAKQVDLRAPTRNPRLRYRAAAATKISSTSEGRSYWGCAPVARTHVGDHSRAERQSRQRDCLSRTTCGPWC